MLIDDMTISVMATRYSTNDVPDVIFFTVQGNFRGTWNQAENAPDFWMTPVTDNEIHNVTPV
jgi:hypothetical protein